MSQPTVSALDPQVLTAGPLVLPPQRRLMVLLMLALAILLQVATSGWGPIGDGSDGMNASLARELALGLSPAEISQLWHQRIHPTLAQWITAQSFQIFNVNEPAARLPFAVANLLVVGLVFFIAERTGGFWRGLSSGILAATMSGTILHGRDGGGAALTALFLTLAFYAAVRMLEQKSHFRWQLFYWCSVAALLALGKPVAALLSLAGVWTVFACFREARIRLRPPWWITGNLLFLGVLAFFFLCGEVSLPTLKIGGDGKYFRTLLPWSAVMLPPLFLRIRKVLRLNELTPAEALLWAHFILATLWVLLFSENQEWPDNVACLAPIFALLSSMIWERTGRRVRMVGVGSLVALAIGGLGFCGRVAGKEWLNLLQPIWWLSLGVIIVFGISAIAALYLRHSRAALLTIAASTIPLAYNLLDARARHDWQHAMKDLGKKVELGYMPGTQIFLDEPLEAVSSFLFYAPHGLRIRPLQSDMHPEANDYLLIRREKPVAWPGAEKIGNNRTHFLFLIPNKGGFVP